ncbi:DivIVA domain-containing protein [Modestobacter sp. SSW1-42]|uniref:DivIVA domain-containing protein n=1 Tax=Modestobacter sp. SSW1-42 TaxID=596372 RepID=UPI003985B81E
MTRSVQLPVVRYRGRRRPNPSGDLGQLLSTAPCFRRRLTGYDRLQVDNYLSWAESELELAGRQLDELTHRLGRCTAQLQQAEQRLATSPAGWEMGRVSDRVAEILRLAADEAADLVEAGIAEGERLRAEGEEAAVAVLQEAHAVRAQAVADSDRLRESAQCARRTAEAELEQVRTQVAVLLHVVAAQQAEAATAVTEAHRIAQQVREAAQAEFSRAETCRALAEQVVTRLSDELETALGELEPAPAVLAVVPAAPVPESSAFDRADRRSAS